MYRCGVCNEMRSNKDCRFMAYIKRKGSSGMGVCNSCLILSKAVSVETVTGLSKIYDKLNIEVKYGKEKTERR